MSYFIQSAARNPGGPDSSFMPGGQGLHEAMLARVQSIADQLFKGDTSHCCSQRVAVAFQSGIATMDQVQAILERADRVRHTCNLGREALATLSERAGEEDSVQLLLQDAEDQLDYYQPVSEEATRHASDVFACTTAGIQRIEQCLSSQEDGDSLSNVLQQVECGFSRNRVLLQKIDNDLEAAEEALAVVLTDLDESLRAHDGSFRVVHQKNSDHSSTVEGKSDRADRNARNSTVQDEEARTEDRSFERAKTQRRLAEDFGVGKRAIEKQRTFTQMQEFVRRQEKRRHITS